MTTSEFTYKGEGFEIVAKSVDTGAEIKLEKKGDKKAKR